MQCRLCKIDFFEVSLYPKLCSLGYIVDYITKYNGIIFQNT
jgi:hypothetical protein